MAFNSFVQHFTEAKKRMFDVKVENVMVASKLDVFVSAGGAKKAYVIELNNVDCRDGKMTIEFAQSVNNPILSGLEVIRYGQPVTKTCGIPKVRTQFHAMSCSSSGGCGCRSWTQCPLSYGFIFFAYLVPRYKLEEHRRHRLGVSIFSCRRSRRNDWKRLCHYQWLLSRV